MSLVDQTIVDSRYTYDNELNMHTYFKFPNKTIFREDLPAGAMIQGWCFGIRVIGDVNNT